MDHLGLVINDRFVLNEVIDSDPFVKIYRALDKKKKSVKSIIFIINANVRNCRVDDLIRFRSDIKTAREISHPSVANSYDDGEIESGRFKGQFYAAMENLRGRTLSSLLSRSRESLLSIHDSISIMIQLCDALDSLHSAGIIHHKIMPRFIIVSDKKKDGGLKVTLTGTGFSHVMNYIEGINAFTESFQYIAPEESGILKRTISECSDLYSAGIILYRMLTGEAPYSGDTISSILHKHVASAPLKPGEINPGIPAILERIILRLLNKEPAERYHTAWGLKTDLEYYYKNSVNDEFIIGKSDIPVRLERKNIFIGRDEELKQLEEALLRIKGNKGSICLIEGESGSGKSRLVGEFREKQGQYDIPFITAKCFPGEAVTPYNPIIEILTSYNKNFENYPHIKREKISDRIRNGIGSAGNVLAGFIPGIRKIIGDYPDVIKIDPEREQRRFIMAWEKLFSGICLAEGGLIIFIDDIHWMDDESYKLLQAVSLLTTDFPLLLILTYRSEELQRKVILNEYLNSFRDKGILSQKILCSPLSNNDLRQFVSAVLEINSEGIEPVLSFIAAHNKGNPYLTIEILEYLTNTGAVFFSNGNYCLNRKILDAINIPNNLSRIILTRIENLKDKDRFLITVMSAIGRKFHISLLLSILDQPFSNSPYLQFVDGISREDLVKTVDYAVSSNFIYPDKSEKGLYKFMHDKIIEALQQNTSPGMLRTINLMIANTEAKLYEDGDNDVVFSLANHSIACGDAGLITRYVADAAQAASERFAYNEAIRLFSSVIKVLEKHANDLSNDIADLRSRCIRGIAEAQIVTGDYDNAIKAFKELLSTVGGRVEQALIYKQLCVAYFKKGAWQEVESCAETGLRLLGEKLPVKNIRVVLSLVTEAFKHFFTLLNKNAFAESRRGAKAEKYKIIIQFYIALNWSYGLSDVIKFSRSVLRMLNISMSKISKSQELATSISAYASLCMIIPFFKRALKYHKISLDMHEELNNKWGIGQSLQYLGYLHQWKGEYDISIDYLNKAINVFSEIGDTWEQGMSFHGLDLDYIYMGDYDRASDYIMKFINISEESGDSAGICGAYDDLLWMNSEREKPGKGVNSG